MNTFNLFNLAPYEPPATATYFYGRLLRIESEYILKNRGCRNGLFLLRESTIDTGSYVLSLCHESAINHYKIKRQEDGSVAIKYTHAKLGPTFIGPIELVNYYQIEAKNLCTRPSIPCSREPTIQPINYIFINDSEFYILVNNEIKKHLNHNVIGDEKYFQEKIDAMGRFRYKYEKIVLCTLHQKQQWYRKDSDRFEAEKLLNDSGNVNGKFLVRGDDDKGYRISLCYENNIIHYKILSFLSEDKRKYSLDSNDMLFDTIIHLVDHYHRCSDKLIIHPLIHPYISKPFPSNPEWLDVSLKNRIERWSSVYDSASYYKRSMNNPVNSDYLNDKDDEPVNGTNDFSDLKDIPELKRSLFESEENYEYEAFSSYTIDLKDLDQYDQLGAGNFGSVYRGTFKLKVNQAILEIPVAIKQLNLETEESKKEMSKEAELMKSLNNPHIVKFIGMCFDNNSLRIVLELAKLGPLHKYLRTHKDMSMKKIVRICYQVALAMEYLSAKGLVHRDLAARNVLLVTEDLSKVSDFGLSRRLDESNYYDAQAKGKWPLKWYPPDATIQGRFDEKSDVWSFGVTCWEATSYGSRPYQGIDIGMVLIKLENGHRLEKPAKCPVELYDAVMHPCWLRERNSRPKFKDIVKEIEIILNDPAKMSLI